MAQQNTRRECKTACRDCHGGCMHILTVEDGKLVGIRPDTVAKHGIEQGDWVFIETPRGRITQKAELVPELDPMVINCQFGWWYPEDPSPLHGCFESNANVLTVGAPPYDEFGAYQMRGLLCRISRNPSKAIEERYYASDLSKF